MHAARESTTCTNLSQTSFCAAWIPAAVFVDDRMIGEGDADLGVER